MRLWHYRLIPVLPWKQLTGQHRECVALRGKGWKRSHSTVNYVFTHPYALLYRYHVQILDEMIRRGYDPQPIFYDNRYRGKRIGFDLSPFTDLLLDIPTQYPEHNDQYLRECIANLNGKGKLFDISINSLV